MTSKAVRIAPTPYEEFIIDSILESSNGQEALLDTIQHLTEERNALRMRIAQQPQSGPEARRQIHTIDSQLEALWAEVRRRRAAWRVQLEEALGVDPALVVN